ncbi:hypothetical protein Glo7428_2333 [Gloeocapsa sp. PCC 7428]|uniref:hypothetical protein n=1 Tax=Gloeocapsa sp. PCC 7428 TaxID=1173026 RepID=UPI0002A5C9F4|nr:hypothetical protein [Gloeocapsa sp. PCC 7428]AFZ30845.1 hypothetical protein Glo7428_2333 [Gloeocapsa sp. PCC 7428]
MSSRTNRRNGYLAAVLGSLIGAGTLIPLGLRLGIAYAQTFMPHAELDGLIPPILGGFVGWWMGSVLGCWLGLRWRRYREAHKTAIVLTVLTPLGIFLWVFISINLSNWVRDNISGLGFVQIDETVVTSITIGFTVVVLALLSRLLT